MAERSLRSFIEGTAIGRRALTVPAVAGAAGGLVATSWLWAPVTAAIDLANGERRLPRTRALSAATAWASLESLGVGASSALWALGRSDDGDAHYRLQRWWAGRLLDALRILGDVRIEVDGADQLAPGPIVVALRHVTVADALLPVWLLGQHDMHPRYVLKRELLLDPCLDVVGNRVPNHFVERSGDATEQELAAIESLATGMGAHDAAVIYPEGTTASDERRTRALASIAERDAARAARLGELKRLLPPRSAGLRALLDGAPDADLVFVDHTGFEPLADLKGAASHIPLADAVRIRVQRIARRDVPGDRDEFKRWLDDAWLALDRGVQVSVSRE